MFAFGWKSSVERRRISEYRCLGSILIMITERNISQYNPTGEYSRIESTGSTDKIGESISCKVDGNDT